MTTIRPPRVPPPLPPAVRPSQIPPIPPRVSHAASAPASAAAIAAPIQIDLRPSQPRPRSRSAVTGLVAWALAFFVALVAAYMAWPNIAVFQRAVRQFQAQQDSAATTVLSPKTPPPVTPQAHLEPPAKPGANPVAEPKPAPGAPPEAPASNAQPPAPPPAGPASPHAAASPPSPTAPPPIDVEKVRSRVGAAIAQAFAALREQDFAKAKQVLDGVAETALDDQQATDRLQRWQQLVVYAQGYPEYRDKALTSAAKTAATYDVGKRKIGVVEFNEKRFVYRDSRNPGQNLSVPRDKIPADVEKVLVEAWFAVDGRASNHLFLGAAALSQRRPDVDTARRDWQKAADGGEADGSLLLELLEDPAIRGE